MKKSLIIGLIATILVVIGIVTIVVVNKEDDSNIPLDDKYSLDVTINDQVVDNIRFSNIDVQYNGEYTSIILNITNDNDQKILINDYIVELFDQNGNKLGELNPNYNLEIEPYQMVSSTFGTLNDYSNVASLQIKLPNLEFID